LEQEVWNNITATLFVGLHFFDFANQYRHKHKTLPSPSEFVVSDQIFNEFKKFLDDRDIDYKTQTEILLERLIESAREENYFDAIKRELDLVRQLLSHDKDTDLIKHKAEIKEILGMELVSRFYFQKGLAEFALRSDRAVQRAIETLQNPQSFRDFLR
jgi:carboxyl-terminal processing protease